MQLLLWGILSSLIGNCLIGVSFTLKRWISLPNNRGSTTNLCGRLRLWRWWLAVLTLLVGEILNFVAYVTAPSFLVVMLGCVNVLATQISSALFLKEYFTSVRLMGTLFIGLGITLCIVSTPLNEHPEIDTLPEVVARLGDTVPQILFTSAMTSLLLLTYVACRLERSRVRNGHVTSEGVQVSIAAIGLSMYGFGAMLTVTTTKAVGIVINEAVFDFKFRTDYAPSYLIWPLALMLWVTQLMLINWLLSHLEASAVTPLMYIIYTVSGVFASGIFYDEFADHTSVELILLFLATLLMAFGSYCVTRTFPRSQGFWPLCCPHFELSTEKTFERLDVEGARREWIEEHCNTTITTTAGSTSSLSDRVGDDDDDESASSSCSSINNGDVLSSASSASNNP